MNARLLVFPVMLAACFAAGAEPEIDSAEVLRLGDMVQHVGGIRQDANDKVVEAMAVPQSDADKWFVSVLTTRGCAPCAKLKADWEKNQWLRSLADPHDQKKSWAHLQWYDSEDKSQAWRFRDIKVTGYPTVIVQPPRTGKYGDPSTVVYQGGYGGDPEKLARQISDAIKRYVLKLEQQAKNASGEDVASSSPPWEPPPKVDPIGPDGSPVFPDGRPLIPPSAPEPQAAGLLHTVAVAMATAVAVLLIVYIGPAARSAIRRRREERRRRDELIDAMLAQMANKAGAASSTAAGSAPSSVP